MGLLAGLVSAPGAAAQSSAKAKLSIDVSAQRFVVEGDRVVARGPVVAEVERADGTVERVTRQVNLRVKPTKNCRILELRLAELYLNLLGLETRTSTITLRVTGKSKQTLGKLFCSLSEGLKIDKNVLARKAARSLNKELHNRPLQVLRLRAPIRVQKSDQAPAPAPSDEAPAPASRVKAPPPAPGSCEVLDLLLGPLNLNLLGLVVDLYGETSADPVRVLITADPAGGVLGATFCELAGASPPEVP